MCTYIAATMQLAEGADNVMLDAAANLHLGTGTETTTTAAAAPVAAAGPAGPVARIPAAQLADPPAAVRPGQRAPVPAGARVLPLDKLGALLAGGGM